MVKILIKHFWVILEVLDSLMIFTFSFPDNQNFRFHPQTVARWDRQWCGRGLHWGVYAKSGSANLPIMVFKLQYFGPG